jgi:hypothetical protein
LQRRFSWCQGRDYTHPLLGHGLDIKGKDYNIGPLILAAYRGCYESVEWLQQLGADATVEAKSVGKEHLKGDAGKTARARGLTKISDAIDRHV